MLEGPVRLRYLLEGFTELGPKLLALQRLLSVQRRGRFRVSLFPPERRANRWVLILRALDGTESGATHRELAALLFDEGVTETD